MHTCRQSLFVLALACGLPLGSSPSAQAEVFLLRTGGRVEGEWLNPQRGQTEEYLLRNQSGVQLTLAGSAVTRVLTTSNVQKQYDELLHKAPATVDGHWKLAEWCQDAGLAAQRKFHLEQVIKLDPDHEEARLALGYGRFANGGWMTPDEYMQRQGYVKYRGVWKLPQEIEIDAREREFELADKQWRKQLKIWIDNYVDGRKRMAEAAQGIKNIRDPAAASALSAALDDDELPKDVRLMCLEAVSNLPPGLAMSTLIKLAIHDPDEGLRDRCLTEIKRQGPHHAVPVFIKELSSKDNKLVKRAAIGLHVMGDVSATKPLIDALVTKHKFVIQGNPGQMSASFGGGGNNGGLGGMSMGQKTQVFTRDLPNQEALAALSSLHPGVNYGYNKDDWKRWFMTSKATLAPDLRRGE
jgi:hypothetical protein